MNHNRNAVVKRRIIELGKRKTYSYRHIQIILEDEGYGKPSLSFIWKVIKEFIKLNK